MPLPLLHLHLHACITHALAANACARLGGAGRVACRCSPLAPRSLHCRRQLAATEAASAKVAGCVHAPRGQAAAGVEAGALAQMACLLMLLAPLHALGFDRRGAKRPSSILSRACLAAEGALTIAPLCLAATHRICISSCSACRQGALLRGSGGPCSARLRRVEGAHAGAAAAT